MAAIGAPTAPLSTVVPQQKVPANYSPEDAAHLAKAREVAQRFEASFIYQFMELTAPSLDKNSMMSGGFGEEMFRHQMNEQAAGQLDKGGGFGIADHIMAQLAMRGDIPPLNPPVQNPYANINLPLTKE